MKRTRLLPWIALAVVAVAAVVALASRSGPDRSVDARAARLEHQLRCPVCAGESVADSNAQESRAIRADIEERLRKGQPDREILAAEARSYPGILLTPGDSGVDLVAWAVPIGALLLGSGGIVLALRRWSREPRLAATPEDEETVARERKR